MTAPSERRIKFTLHYDGSGFYGWQVQPGVRTVQSELDAALSRLADRPVSCLAAGRTDRGVHATGQVVSAVMPGQWTAAEARRSLNAILPRDIWVAHAMEVPLSFHPVRDAVARSYAYRIGTAEAAWSPFERRWCWPLDEPLDAALLAETAVPVRGEHSFRSFAKTGQEARGFRCTVEDAAWHDWPGLGSELRITADRFLHHMVRYLVGTMVDVARGRRPASDMQALLDGEDGLTMSPPAPPQGLFLSRVYYPEHASRETPDDGR